MVLRIIESCPEEPIRFPTDPGSHFVPGQVGQIDYDRMVCGVSDGTRPLGLIDDIRTASIDSTDPGGLITIWSQRVLFRTDQYEEVGVTYETGDRLYVNSAGFLTNIRLFEEAVPVGRVNSIFETKQPYDKDIIECLWF